LAGIVGHVKDAFGGRESHLGAQRSFFRVSWLYTLGEMHFGVGGRHRTGQSGGDPCAVVGIGVMAVVQPRRGAGREPREIDLALELRRDGGAVVPMA
jgi:hypothetical protein